MAEIVAVIGVILVTLFILAFYVIVFTGIFALAVLFLFPGLASGIAEVYAEHKNNPPTKEKP